MTAREIFRIWAPPQLPWSPWAKPVLFTGLRPAAGTAYPAPPELPPECQRWLAAHAPRTAIIMDLPGAAGVTRALQLATRGFRPVPVFNTTADAQALVNVDDIVRLLPSGAEFLAGVPLAERAPPVFVLDARRQHVQGRAQPGQYDNRWLVFAQDFPSARFLRQAGVESLLLWQSGRIDPQEDLTHVLLRWQQDGLQLLAFDEASALAGPVPLIVSRPSRFRHLFHRLFALAGLRRNSAGGFGARVPTPSRGHG